MRIPSGTTNRYVYFVAVDATDFTTRETGLSSFTVYRSRNGGAAAAMTTPTINETDATNMPGVYELLLDEDTTLTAGNDTEEIAFHITHAGMAPVTRVIELYRPETTEGNTLDVTATGAAGIDWANVENQSTSVDLSATAINLCDTVTTNTDMRGTDSAFLAASAPTNFGDLAITATTGKVTVGTNDDKTGYSIGGTITTLDALDTAQDTQHSTTQSAISALNDPTAAAIADAVWLETLADHSGTAGSTAEALNAAGAAGDPWTTALPGAYGAGSAGNIIGNLNDPTAAAIADAVLDEAMAGHVTAGSLGKYIADILVDTAEIGAAGAGLTSIPWNAAWDAEVQSECTDALNAYDPPTNAEMAAEFTAIKGATWSAVTDTLEAIRDRGDSAWITATGFSTHSAADVRTEIDSNSTQLAAIVADTNELQTDWANGGRLDLLVDAILEDTGTTLPAAIPSAATIATTVLTTQMVESYAAAGAAPTLTQAVCWLYQDVQEAAVSGTTKTVKKLDQSTTAGTVTLDDANTPTSLTRAT